MCRMWAKEAQRNSKYDKISQASADAASSAGMSTWVKHAMQCI